MGKLVDLGSHVKYRPDTAALACGKVVAARTQLDLEHDEFATELGNLLSWEPSPGVVRAWERGIAAPPGDVIAACDILVSRIEAKDQPDTQSSHPEKLNTDEQERIRKVIHSPVRLDMTTVVNLSGALNGQRHAEDSLGPSLIIGPMSEQRAVLEALVRNYHGPYEKRLMQLVANWTTYVGWLHTACEEYSDAATLFAKAEKMASAAGDGVLTATATSYRGYLAMLQGRYRSALKHTEAALDVSGAHPTQNGYDALQAAQAYAKLGDRKEARQLLHKASDMVTTAGVPPETVYWYTEPFLRMNIGMTQSAIGEHRDAADSISSGLTSIPTDQQQAEWLDEYKQALNYSSTQADRQG